MTLGSTGTLTINAIAPASISAAAGVSTWMTTPSSANLRGALTDENGTGAALFSGATTPDFTTGFTIGAAAAAGKIPIGNGTNYVPSTPVFPTTVGTSGQIIQSNGSTGYALSTPTWPTAAGTSGVIVQSNGTNLVTSTATWPTTNTAGYSVVGNGTNYTAYPQQLTNASTASVVSSFAADTYLTGSAVTVAAGDIKARGQYHCVFDVAKTAAGVATPIVTIRAGTAGTTADTAVCVFTFGAGTAASDTGMFEVWLNIRTTGVGASSERMCKGVHNLATTGLFNNAALWMIGAVSGSTFNSNTATIIGLSFNGGSSFVGTNTLVQAQLEQP
jgi:hypothetical protein